MPPKYDGMPPTDRTYDVGRWGEIRCGGPCRDDYGRIVIYHQSPARYVKLQKAAIESLKDAEQDVRQKIWVTGSWRSCSLQRQLRASDPSRFADPNETAHTRGLAIDVSQNQTGSDLRAIHKALISRWWFQARPSDEPWHYSFGIQV